MGVDIDANRALIPAELRASTTVFCVFWGLLGGAIALPTALRPELRVGRTE